MIVPTLRKRHARSGDRRSTRWMPFVLMSSATVAMAAVLFSACSVGDQNCLGEEDPGADCPYGPPGGPRLKYERCENTNMLAPDSPTCTEYTWEKVYALLTDETATGGQCSVGNCHGVTASDGLLVPKDNPGDAYNNLVAFAPDSARGPYVNSTNPELSWITCNLRGLRSGGSPMPKPNGLLKETDITLVENWVACGAKGPGTATGDAGTGADGGDTDAGL